MKLGLNDIASLAFAASGIGEKNTVSNGPDDGANNCQATHWWRVTRHGTTAQAIDNVVNAPLVTFDPPAPEIEISKGLASTGAANLVGHANEGQFETGMGQHGVFDNAKIVLPWNEWAWGPEFDRLQTTPVTYVSLWGCHPGAGPDGAELVYAVAKRCGRAVRAGTGFLYCNSRQIWWENGTQWQVGTPTHKPTPIAAPSPHFQVESTALMVGNRDIVAEDVVSIQISQSAWAKISHSVSMEGADAVAVVKRIFQSPPIDLSGVAIPALVTGKISLSLKDGTSTEMIVYNDRMAVEPSTGTGYYIASLHLLSMG